LIAYREAIGRLFVEEAYREAIGRLLVEVTAYKESMCRNKSLAV
jgi:hypothetical protein